MKILKLIFALNLSLLIFFTQNYSPAQVNIKIIDEKEKDQVVENISKILADNYVFPDKAAEMNNFIFQKLKNNEYSSISDSRIFSEQLTNDLQSVSKDKHLRVMYNPEDAEKIKNQGVGKKEGADFDEEMIKNAKYENFGFKKVERLNGNLGYIDFRNFFPAKYSKETIASVMGFLSNCDAIIIDLRQNGGGDPTSVQQISSYFFGENPVHLNDLYFRPQNRTDEFWTLKDIPGKRLPNVDLYILTSNFTFSAAEEFTYNLKNLKRAVIVGETTGGGAHPGDMIAVNENFVAFIPNGRAINPITKTNWEGTGVIPDIEVSQDKALETARMKALEKFALKTSDEKQKNKYLWEIEAVKAALDPVRMSGETLRSFTGSFGDREVTFENGDLYYLRKGRRKLKMIPMGEDMFMFNEADYFRIKFNRDTNGNVSEFNGIYDNGEVAVIPKQ